MDPLEIGTLAEFAQGKMRRGRVETTVRRVWTDTRNVEAGDLFLALKGPNFDGHAYIGEAAAKGAIGAVVERGTKVEVPGEFAVIEVDETLAGLHAIAAAYRRSLKLRVVGITGTNGKTSTKDMTAAVLGARFRVLKTEGNFNNHIGLPLTVLRAGRQHDIGVFEMGMSHRGEIAPLAKIAAPDVGIVTNIGRAHIENLGTIDEIAREKGDLLAALPVSGAAVLGADEPMLEALAGRVSGRVLLAGIRKGDLRAVEIRQTVDGAHFILEQDGERVAAAIPVPGIHMIQNALLAVAAGRQFGLSLTECARGLRRVVIGHGRLQRKNLRGATVIDDTYNANPDSAAAALRTLAAIPAKGRRIAVLGVMRELGEESEPGHRQVGRVAGETGITCLVAVGVEAAWIAAEARTSGVSEVREAVSNTEAADILRTLLQPGDVVLLKGSRSTHMEEILEKLEKEA